MPLHCRTIERLLNEAFDCCENLFKTEMASMYLRHHYRKTYEIAMLLVEQGWLAADEATDDAKVADAIKKIQDACKQRATSSKVYKS